MAKGYMRDKKVSRLIKSGQAKCPHCGFTPRGATSDEIMGKMGAHIADKHFSNEHRITE